MKTELRTPPFRSRGHGAIRRPGGSAPATAALAALAIAAAGCAAERGAEGELAGFELPEPRAKTAFTLTDTNGEPFDFRERTTGTLTLVFFGYTYCPDICSVTMANLGAALERIPSETRDRTRVIFITTDPDRDTPQRIRGWLDQFHPELKGLRGDTARVNAVMRELGLPPAMREAAPEGSEDYTVGHAGYVLVFTPDDSLRYMYSASTRRLDWIRDLNRLAAIGAGAAP